MLNEPGREEVSEEEIKREQARAKAEWAANLPGHPDNCTHEFFKRTSGTEKCRHCGLVRGADSKRTLYIEVPLALYVSPVHDIRKRLEEVQGTDDE